MVGSEELGKKNGFGHKGGMGVKLGLIRENWRREEFKGIGVGRGGRRVSRKGVGLQ